MAEIYDLPLRYFIPKLGVNYAFKRYYRPYIVVGEENIPRDAPFIFAANHLNALMDALAMLSIMPWRHSIVFLARADMFRNKTAAFWLNYLKIMPAFRIRDGRENMTQNNDTFEKSVAVLHAGNAIGILPEGNQGSQRKMRPLQKGICRIAFTAQEKYGQEKKVKVVSVGLDYGDFIKYGKHIIINIGKPIEVADYMPEYMENAPAAMNSLRDKIAADLHGLTLDLASNEHYEAFETIAYALDRHVCEQQQQKPDVLNRFRARQQLAGKLCAAEASNPEQTAFLAAQAGRLEQALKATHLKAWLLQRPKPGKGILLLQLLALLVCSPIFIIGFVCNCLPFFLPVIIRKDLLKARNPLFYSSVHFGFTLIIYPLLYILQLVAVGLCVSWHPTVLLGALAIFALSGRPACIWYSQLRKWIAKIRYTRLSRKNDTHLQEALQAYNELKKWYDTQS